MDAAEGVRACNECLICGGPHSRGQCDQYLVDSLVLGEQVRLVSVHKPKKKNLSNET